MAINTHQEPHLPPDIHPHDGVNVQWHPRRGSMLSTWHSHTTHGIRRHHQPRHYVLPRGNTTKRLASIPNGHATGSTSTPHQQQLLGSQTNRHPTRNHHPPNHLVHEKETKLTTCQIYKWKERMNIDGSKQKKGIHYDQYYSPVANWDAIRIILTLTLK